MLRRAQRTASPPPYLTCPRQQLGPVSPSRYDQRGGAMKTQRRRAVHAGSTEGGFHLRIFFLRVCLRVEQPSPAPIHWIITWATPEQTAVKE